LLDSFSAVGAIVYLPAGALVFHPSYLLGIKNLVNALTFFAFSGSSEADFAVFSVELEPEIFLVCTFPPIWNTARFAALLRYRHNRQLLFKRLQLRCHISLLSPPNFSA